MNQNARSRLGERVNYEVGYRRPPVHSRFQRGRSGNPRGRPRRLMPTANDLFSQELPNGGRKRQGGKVTKMPLIQALFRAYMASAAKGSGQPCLTRDAGAYSRPLEISRIPSQQAS